MDQITIKIMILIIGYILAIIFFVFDFFDKKNEKIKEINQLRKNNNKRKLDAIRFKEDELTKFKSKYLKWALVIGIISALGISGGIYLIFQDAAQYMANKEENSHQEAVIKLTNVKVDSLINAGKEQVKRDSLILVAIQDSLHVKGFYLKQNLGIGNLYNVNYQSPLIKLETGKGGSIYGIKMSNVGNVVPVEKHK